MSLKWGQVIFAIVFLVLAVALRIWAARRYGKVRGRIEDSEFRDAFNALRLSSETVFLFLIMALVWIATQAWTGL